MFRGKFLAGLKRLTLAYEQYYGGLPRLMDDSGYRMKKRIVRLNGRVYDPDRMMSASTRPMNNKTELDGPLGACFHDFERNMLIGEVHSDLMPVHSDLARS